MELFLLSQLFILLIIVGLFVLLSFVWPPDSPWSPWWKTSVVLSRIVCQVGKVTKNDTLFELGSGNGTTLMVAAKEFGAKGVGVEIDPLRYWYSRYVIWRCGLSANVVLHRKNFFAVDISEATIVYVYLVPKALKKLKNKFLEELAPGTKIVSLKYTIPYLEEISLDKEHDLHVYITPKHKK